MIVPLVLHLLLRSVTPMRRAAADIHFLSTVLHEFHDTMISICPSTLKAHIKRSKT